MARINYNQPCTLPEVESFLADARFGYEAADARVYTRHVTFLLTELGRQAEQLRAQLVEVTDALADMRRTYDETPEVGVDP